MLADGSQKPIEDVTYGDDLLTWDFDHGCLSHAKSAWIKRAEKTDYRFVSRFADGRTLETTGPRGHRVFDGERFVYNTEAVGRSVRTEDGWTEMVSCVKERGEFEYYNVITAGNMNLFANGILTSCRYSNVYPVKGMKYVKDGRTLRDPAEFAGLEAKYVDGLRLSEQAFDADEIRRYVGNLMNKDIAKEA